MSYPVKAIWWLVCLVINAIDWFLVRRINKALVAVHSAQTLIFVQKMNLCPLWLDWDRELKLAEAARDKAVDRLIRFRRWQIVQGFGGLKMGCL